MIPSFSFVWLIFASLFPTSSPLEWLFPWEQARVTRDPWVLLELTRHPHPWVRRVAVAALADKQDWEGGCAGCLSLCLCRFLPF